MRLYFNDVFKQLLKEYHIPEDLSFSVNIPPHAQEIIDDSIIKNELGITLKSFNRLYKAKSNWETQSIIEDNENHFHVDWYIEPPDAKQIFMLGIKTLILLATKFEAENVEGVRFWHFFEPPEINKMTESKEIKNEETTYISERLSFYTRREGEDIITPESEQNKPWAVMIIDI